MPKPSEVDFTLLDADDSVKVEVGQRHDSKLVLQFWLPGDEVMPAAWIRVQVVAGRVELVGKKQGGGTLRTTIVRQIEQPAGRTRRLE